MTLNVVLGAGEMPVKELHATLKDLHAKANQADDPFWFLVEGKAEPTDTDRALVNWLNTNNVWYDTIGDGSAVDKLYSEGQNVYEAKRLAPKVVELMGELPEEGEAKSRLLGIWSSDDFSAEEDRWLNDVGTAVAKADYAVYALNDGMVEIDMLADEEEPAAEPEPEAAAPTKTKKPKPPTDDEPVAAAGAYTREALEAMGRDEIVAIAIELGIDLPSRTRTPTFIKRILGEEDTLEAVAEPVEVEAEAEVEAEVSATEKYAEQIVERNGEVEGGTAMAIFIVDGTLVSFSLTPAEAFVMIGSRSQ